MSPPKPQLSKSLAEAALDDTMSDAEMDRRLAEHPDEIDALLQEAYDAEARGESAPLEPLHILLAEERARFDAGRR